MSRDVFWEEFDELLPYIEEDIQMGLFEIGENEMDDKQMSAQIAQDYIVDVKEWLLELLAEGRITREEYEFQCNRLVLAQASIDDLIEDNE